MIIKIRNPNVFKSVEFDVRIAYSSSIMVSTVKKQMPNTEASRQFDKGTEKTS